MKFGIFLSAQQTRDANLLDAFRSQIDLVRLTRDKGWDSFFTGQHYLSEGNVQHLQNLPFLARLKAEAGDMMLGIGVLLINLHNPVYVAETVATMDVIAEGNMAFGVGLGYRDMEFDAFGVRRGER